MDGTVIGPCCPCDLVVFVVLVVRVVLAVFVVSALAQASWSLCFLRCLQSMRRTPSLANQVTNDAQLRAGGTFRGFKDWMKEQEVEVLLNLLGDGRRAC